MATTGAREGRGNDVQRARTPGSLANDFGAMDLVKALNELGYSVPDDIWVCGFDDSQEASYFAPHLTSIHIHGQIMGYTAANLLMTRIEEPLLNYRTVYTETNLILRESTGD